jgi:hypothetical protein
MWVSVDVQIGCPPVLEIYFANPLAKYLDLNLLKTSVPVSQEDRMITVMVLHVTSFPLIN